MSRRPHALLPALLIATLSGAAAAQQPQAPAPSPQPVPAPGVVYTPQTNARELQQQLRDLMEQYPPTLGEVLRLDSSLLTRPDYLAPYPALVAFLQQHPEVQRNPSFFFGQRPQQSEQSAEIRAVSAVQDVLLAFWFLCGFTVVVSLMYSLLRQALEYRRWRRQVQIQTEMQTKLVDKLTTGQEMLTYLENSGGKRLMEWPPIPAESRTIAPVTRILWSVQIGIVIAAVGIGFWSARGTIGNPELFNVFEVMGTMATAIGVGFVLSAVVSWFLSLRLGLITTSKADA